MRRRIVIPSCSRYFLPSCPRSGLQEAVPSTYFPGALCRSRGCVLSSWPITGLCECQVGMCPAPRGGRVMFFCLWSGLCSWRSRCPGPLPKRFWAFFVDPSAGGCVIPSSSTSGLFFVSGQVCKRWLLERTLQLPLAGGRQLVETRSEATVFTSKVEDHGGGDRRLTSLHGSEALFPCPAGLPTSDLAHGLATDRKSDPGRCLLGGGRGPLYAPETALNEVAII